MTNSALKDVLTIGLEMDHVTRLVRQLIVSMIKTTVFLKENVLQAVIKIN